MSNSSLPQCPLGELHEFSGTTYTFTHIRIVLPYQNNLRALYSWWMTEEQSTVQQHPAVKSNRVVSNMAYTLTVTFYFLSFTDDLP